MDSKPDQNEPPDETRVLESVQRVEPLVLAGIGMNRARHQRIRVGVSILAGLGLFAGGVAVGAAALRPSVAASADVRDAPAAGEFVVDCYSSTTPGAKAITVFQAPGAASSVSGVSRLFGEQNPTAACDSYRINVLSVGTALDRETHRLEAKGIRPGYIHVAGGHTYKVIYPVNTNGTSGAVIFAQDDSPGVPISATISVPAVKLPSTAECEVAQNWVKVYPRGSTTEAQLCASLGLSVWKP